MRDLECLAASLMAAMSTSCPFLDKLAPETRVKIYGYALTFDTPIKHADNMRPFLERITDAKAEAEQPVESTTDVESGDTTTGSLYRINTSILSTNKLIYKESIAVFYENNIIHFNAPDFNHSTLVLPCATDLSLATQLIVRVKTEYDFEGFCQLAHAMELALEGLPAIFPRFRTGTVYFYTGESHPVRNLFRIAKVLRLSPNFTASFEAVGQLIATCRYRPGLKFVVQSTVTTESWINEVVTEKFDPATSSAKCLYQHSRAGGECSEVFAALIKIMFIASETCFVPKGYPAITYDSHEFWTVIEASMRTARSQSRNGG